MGTRSLTKIIKTWETDKGEKGEGPMTCMYRQYDGDVDGHGYELAKFLEPFIIVNGLGISKNIKIANGIECLAAQMFAHFKECPGNIYCMHPDTMDVGEEYIYEVEYDDENILITVYQTAPRGYDGHVKLYQGTPEKLIEKIEKIKTKENA
tara:strand:+ start:96 stop:548 length:453 start_codon:yes stop_codon:yes gene_type:complete